MIQASKFVAAVALGATLAAPLAMAAEPAVELRPQTYNQIAVINGGVSLDEAAMVKQMASRYPLRVVMSGRGGDYYVADRMSISRDGRVVAQIPDAGPWLLLDVPPGRYTLTGIFNGVEMQRQVTVAQGSGTTVHWVVPNRLN